MTIQPNLIALLCPLSEVRAASLFEVPEPIWSLACRNLKQAALVFHFNLKRKSQQRLDSLAP
jgi:hypothetical protein